MIGRAVEAHRGVLLRWTGDGVKATFPTSSAAVAAAIEMQRAVRSYGRRKDAVAPFQIRIGVSVGEVSNEDGDDHGVAGSKRRGSRRWRHQGRSSPPTWSSDWDSGEPTRHSKTSDRTA